MCGSDIARALRVDKGVVTRYMKKNGIALPRAVVYKMAGEKMKGKSIVSPYGDFFLLCCYLDIPIKQIARLLGYTESVIFTRMRQLGIKVPKEIVEERRNMSQFKPGHVPENKGKKQIEYMSKEAIEISKRTRFKKGQLPPNTKYDGATYTRKDKTGRLYTWIRIGLKNWKMLHVKLWEDKHGPVPPGMIIVFRDRNSQNITLSNLEMISMKENMVRNSIHRYPAELKQVIKLNGKLKKKTNELKQSRQACA